MQRTRVVGYLRVSTESQAEAGISLAAQRAKLETFCLLYELELVEVVEDAGLSAKSLARPGLDAALGALARGDAEGLLVAKLDRLTRSVRDLGVLLDRYFKERFALMSVAESVDTRSAAGRLVLNVLASVSEWEREAIGERTREALAHLKSEGVRLGGEGLGWRRSANRDGQGRRVVEVVPAETATIERIVELHQAGFGLREIARSLELAGVPTKRGGRWSHRTVAGVLRRAEGGPKVMDR